MTNGEVSEEKNLNPGAPVSPTNQPVNVRSCGSLTSISSHTSATSGSSNNSEEQKKKEQNRRNWVSKTFKCDFFIYFLLSVDYFGMLYIGIQKFMAPEKMFFFFGIPLMIYGCCLFLL